MEECPIVKCRGCDEDIMFFKSAKTGKMIPVNLRLITIVTKDGYFHKGFETHFSTCPKAEQFRKHDERPKT
jgi:hypothetical protein